MSEKFDSNFPKNEVCARCGKVVYNEHPMNFSAFYQKKRWQCQTCNTFVCMGCGLDGFGDMKCPICGKKMDVTGSLF